MCICIYVAIGSKSVGIYSSTNHGIWIGSGEVVFNDTEATFEDRLRQHVFNSLKPSKGPGVCAVGVASPMDVEARAHSDFTTPIVMSSIERLLQRVV